MALVPFRELGAPDTRPGTSLLPHHLVSPSLHEGRWHPEAQGDPTHREREVTGAPKWGALSPPASTPHSEHEQ